MIMLDPLGKYVNTVVLNIDGESKQWLIIILEFANWTIRLRPLGCVIVGLHLHLVVPNNNFFIMGHNKKIEN